MILDKRYQPFFLLLVVFFGIKVYGQKKTSKESEYIHLKEKTVSSPGNDYAPFIYKNNMYFVSDRESNVPVKYFDAQSDRILSKLYKCNLKDGKPSGSAILVKEPFQSMEFAGPACETDSFIYVTANKEKAPSFKDGKRALEIREMPKHGPEAMLIATVLFESPDTISYGHPCVIGDTVMYLTGRTQHGNCDILRSKKRKGKWSNPEKLKSKVNTEYNEMFPYYSTPFLYFASDRKGGLGGLDIYLIDLSNEKTLPVALAPPFNSSFDDFSLISNNMLSSGFMSSNRKGNDDIYEFSLNFPVFKDCKSVLSNTYCFTFFEEATLSSKDTIDLTYQWSFSDGTKIKGLEAEHCFNGEGSYDIELNILDRSSGEVFMNQLKFTMEINTVKQLFIDVPDTFNVEEELAFDASLSNPENFTIQKYFWDFGDGTRSLFQLPKHKYANTGTYVVTLGVEGVYNGQKQNRCVTRRITAVNKRKDKVYSLVKPILKGLSSTMALRKLDSLFIDQMSKKRGADKVKLDSLKKIATKKPGKTKEHKKPSTLPGVNENDPYLIAKNIFGPQWQDTLTNYRVHLGASKEHLLPNDPSFKGLGNITEFLVKDQYHYFYGKASEINGILPLYNEAKAKGFEKVEVAAFNSDVFLYDEKSSKFISTYDTLGYHLIMTFYFESNSNKVAADDEKKLIEYISKLKDREINRLGLKGYSDPVGDKVENMRLSRKRALAVKEIIDRQKKNSIGILFYGDTKSVDSNDEDFLKYNRRVELIYLK